MKVEIRLYGALAEDFGPARHFQASTPAEAICAMAVMVKGFRDRLREGAYAVHRGPLEAGAPISPDEARSGALHLRFKPDQAQLHIIPHAAGAKDGGGKAILGGLLVAAAFVIPGGGVLAGAAFSLGGSMLSAGVAQMFAPRPPSENTPRQASEIFADIENTESAGAPIPILFGECEVGSIVASAGISTEDVSRDA